MDTTKERAQLIAEIARELYDRFVMGGWEPQDAYAQIDEWLRRAEHSTETPPPSVAAQTRAMKVAVDYGERVASPEQSTETPPKWGQTRQRDDLKPCPFCGTKAIQQGRLANNSTEQQWRIQCGNPFCERTCMTWVAASIEDADKFWQDRAEAPRPVGTPEKCPECDSTDRRMHGFISHGALVICDDPWHRGPVGTPDSAIESADELAKAAFALGKLAGERGKKP